MFIKTLGFLALFAVAYTKAEIQFCDDKGVIFYEQFTGCEPVYNEGELCPGSYNCPDKKSEPGKCVFQGKEYYDGDEIDVRGGCNQGCTCQADEEGNSILCPSYDCYVEMPAEGCYKNNSLDQCCPGEIVCPTESLITCKYDGKEFGQGELFYPKDTCYECVCGEGFSGDLVEPYCQKVSCGLSNFDFKQLENNCAPFYIKSDYSIKRPNLCCPLRFICGNDVRVVKVKKGGNSGETCQFIEDFEMFLGDVFEVEYNAHPITCSCHVPPFATCTGRYFDD